MTASCARYGVSRRIGQEAEFLFLFALKLSGKRSARLPKGEDA
jgi:hypothetical protein